MNRQLALASIPAASVFSACGSEAPTTPGPDVPDFGFLVRNWVGPITDNTEGEGVLTLSISGGLVQAVGNWSMTRNGQTRTGRLTVVPANSPIAAAPDNQMFANCAELGGLAFWIGTDVSFAQDRMAGNYSSVQCAGFTGGKFTVIRQ